MNKLAETLRGAFIRFLGLNQLSLLKDDEPYRRIAQELLKVHRVFGDPQRVVLGRNVVLNDALINTSSGRVTLEDDAFCAHGVSLLTGTHDYRATGFARQAGVPVQGRDIVVGQGVWLGSNVTVLGPCRIGRDAVVAAGAVVTGDVETRCIYAGVPARRIGSIDFTDAQAPTSQ